MAGRPATSDFGIGWRNDFFKAQPGTFVPFTITIDRARVKAQAGAPVCARRRAQRTGRHGRRTSRRVLRSTPSFRSSCPPRRGSPSGSPGASRSRRASTTSTWSCASGRPIRWRREPSGLKAAVLKQPLTVPDFWTGELTTSTVMLADRIEALASPIAAGRPARAAVRDRAERSRRRAGLDLPARSRADRGVPDLQPDGHGGQAVRRPGGLPCLPAYRHGRAGTGAAGDHPPARRGERYVSHTTPQRFNPATMGVAGSIPRPGSRCWPARGSCCRRSRKASIASGSR